MSMALPGAGSPSPAKQGWEMQVKHARIAALPRPKNRRCKASFMAAQDNQTGSDQQAPMLGSVATLAPGSIIGGTWIIERVLGKGGMGTVWLARHQRLANKRSAIKVLHGTGLTDEAYVRFAREAEISTKIGHPNIVDVLDLAALDSGEPYIVLEFLQGEVLRDKLKRQATLTFDEVCAITRQIGSALLAAHRHEVVHRDLKPENVFLVPTDSGGTIHETVKVLDFGISKLRGSQTVQTQEAVLLGTPQYMAPEQAMGRNNEIDGRSDQFALAVMVYEMLTGAPPWVADTPIGLLFQIVHSPTPPLAAKAPQVPAYALQAIERALSKKADDRYADIGDFVAALTGQALQSLDPRKGGAVESGAVVRVNTQNGAPTQQDLNDVTFDGTQPLGTDVTFDGSAAVTAQTAAGDVATPAALLLAPRAAIASVADAPVAPVQPVQVGAARPEVADVVGATPSAQAPTVAASGAAAASDRVPTGANAKWLAIGAIGVAAVLGGVMTISGGKGQVSSAVAPAVVPAPVPAVVPPASAPPPVAAAHASARAPAIANDKQAVVPSEAAKPLEIAQAPAAVTASDQAAPSRAAGEKAAVEHAHPHAGPSEIAAKTAPAVPDEVVTAEIALKNGKVGEAEKAATHSLLTARTSRAFAVLTLVHCKRGDLGGAQTWFGQMSAGKAAVKRACATDGVVL